MPDANGSMSPVVVKVGGSLFDWPPLGPRLMSWLDEFASAGVVLVPGGGPTTDAVRALDRHHGLGEETAHWLALRTLTVNAAFLAALLKERHPVISGTVEDWPDLWRQGRLILLDAYAFARADEQRPGCLPHCWAVTSDSLAARVAVVVGAGRLVLLKSVSIHTEVDWGEASRRGLVDGLFGDIVDSIADSGERPDFKVQALNFRMPGAAL